MKRAQKERIIDQNMRDLNKAKHLIEVSAKRIAEDGLPQDAERLMKLVDKIDALQGKYERF